MSASRSVTQTPLEPPFIRFWMAVPVKAEVHCQVLVAPADSVVSEVVPEVLAVSVVSVAVLVAPEVSAVWAVDSAVALPAVPADTKL